AIIEGLEPFGIKLDLEQNEKGFRQSNVMTLSTPDSTVKVFLIPTNEELVIARDTRDIVSKL
ncbi:MAG: acetate kinase, partial [Clostridia bacterium]|nr:acetate kinase [Clostridia bacterium]